MEVFLIIIGSLFIPAVTIVTVVVLKNRMHKKELARIQKDQELIGTLEELVAVKNDHIKHLK